MLFYLLIYPPSHTMNAPAIVTWQPIVNVRPPPIFVLDDKISVFISKMIYGILDINVTLIVIFLPILDWMFVFSEHVISPSVYAPLRIAE